MNFHCLNFNSYQTPFLGLNRLIFDGEHVSDLGDLSGRRRPERPVVASAADVQAAVPADQPAPAPEAPPESEREAPAKRGRLKGVVDKELEEKSKEFEPHIRSLLENPTQELYDFVNSHSVFEIGKSKATEWNQEFVKNVLGQIVGPRDAQYVVFALQHVLNDLMKKHHNGAEYPFKQERTINAHTRMDGYMGGYTVSVLAGYLNTHKPEAGKPKLAFTKLEKDRADRMTKYSDAMKYLKGIFGEPGAVKSAEDKAAAETAERLSEQEQRYLDQYLLALSQQYKEDVFERINAGSPQFQELFLKVIAHIQEKEVVPGFEHLPQYDIYMPVDLNGWLELFEEMEREKFLTRDEFNVLFPEELEEAAKPYEQSEFVNYPFERTNLKLVIQRLEDFYKGSHYRNLENLIAGEEVDAGLTIVQDFLEQAEYSGPKVRAAYDVYKKAIDDYNAKPLDAKQKAALMKKIKDEILPALRKALDEQKQAALERLRYWEAPGRLPQALILAATDQTRRQLAEQRLPSYMKYQVMNRQPIDDAVFQIFKDRSRNLAFGNYQHLLAASDASQLEALQREFQKKGFLEPARTPEQSAANEKRVVDFFNAAIWIRNIDQFQQERSRHFLSPEKVERVA